MVLGNPTGRVTIQDDDVIRARNNIVAAARDISQAFNSTNPALRGLARDFEVARTAGEMFGATTLGTISRGLRTAAQDMALFSAGAAALVAGGVAATQSNKQLEASYRAILGSAERARQELGEVRQLSDDFKLPFLDAAQGARGFLTTINTTDLSMRTLLITAQKLRLLAPEKTAADASFATRELLSGDTVSIVDQFNLSRTEINRIKKEANGDAAEIIRLLNEYLDRIGATEDALKEMGDSGANAFARARSAAQEALAVAFTPLLENAIVPLLEGFTSLATSLSQNNSVLLQWGSIAALAAASAAPLLFTLSQAIELYGKLKVLAATQLGGTLIGGARTAVLRGVAVGVGTEIGLWGAQKLAEGGVRSGDLGRIADGEDGRSILATRVSQMLAFAISGIVTIFELGKQLLDNAFTQIGASFELGGATLQKVFGLIEVVIGDAIEHIALALEPLIGTDQATQLGISAAQVEGHGNQMVNEADAAQKAAMDKLTITPEEVDAQLAAIRERANKRMLDMYNLFASLLGAPTIKPPSANEQAPRTIETEGKRLTDSLKGVADSSAYDDIQKALAEFARGVEEQNAERQIALGDEQQDYLRGRLRALADDRKDRERIDRQELDREKKQIEALEKIATDADQEELQARKNAAKQREQDLKAHNNRLLDIQHDGYVSLLDAIAQGNGAAAIRAVRDARTQVDRENRDFTERQAQREQDLKDEMASIEQRRDARMQDARDQLEEMRAQFIEQRQERDADFQERLAREDEDRDIRLYRDQRDYARRQRQQQEANDRQIADMWVHLLQEQGVNNAFLNEFDRLVNGIKDSAINNFRDIYAALGRSVSPGAAGYSGLSTADPRSLVENALQDFYRQYAAGRSSLIPAFANQGHVTRSGFAGVDEGEDVVRGRGGMNLTIINQISGEHADADEIAERAAAKSAARVTEVLRSYNPVFNGAI